MRFGLALATIPLGALLWDWIALPYANPNQIVGVLSEQSFNPMTNLLRFAVFVTLPALTWLLLTWMGSRRMGASPRQPDSLDRTHRWSSSALVGMLVLGLVIAVAIGLSRLANNVSYFYLDLFHDGDLLAPAAHWAATGQLWTDNYITRGAFHDVILPVLGWRLFGEQSIGAMKAMYFVVDAAIPVALWMLIAATQYSIRGTTSALQRSALVAILLLAVFGAERLGIAWFQVRDIPVALSIAALLLGFGTRRVGWFVVAGAWAVFTLFTSSDVGIYVLTASGLALATYCWAPDWRTRLGASIGPWLIGAVAVLVVLLLAFGLAEILAWADQIRAVATRWDYVYSYVYPSPLATGSGWLTHTLPMIVMAVLLLVAVVQLPRHSGPDSDTLRAVQMALVALAIIGYRTALGRSDSSHIEQGLAFAAFAIGLIAWLLIRRGREVVQWVALAVASSALVIGGAVLVVRDGAAMAGALPATAAYAAAPDSAFTTPEEAHAAAAIASLVADERCTFVFPNEPAWYYMLLKPPCGRFFFTAHIMGNDYQEEMITTMETAVPKYIIYASSRDNGIDGIPNQIRLSVLNGWLLTRYQPYLTVDGWQVWELK